MKHKILFSFLFVLASLVPGWSQLTTMHATLSGIGIKSLNGLTAKTQRFAIDTTGTDFNISSSGSIHTFNIPTASATNRGLLSSTDWITFNNHFTLPAFNAGSVIFSNGTTLAQDNPNFFWDDTNNRLGIGTTSPSTILNINGGANPGVITLESDNAAYMSIYRYSNNVTRPRYETYKARGTKALPLTIQTGDELAAFDFYGHNGTTFQRNATIYTTAKDVTGSNITAQMNFGFGFTAAATDHYQAFSSAGALFTNTDATNKTPTALIDINYNSLGTTQLTNSGLALTNSTNATAGVPVQISPAIRFTGSRWNTGGTPANQVISVIQDILPISGSSTTNGFTWRLRHDTNVTGTFVDALTANAGEALTWVGNKFVFSSGGESVVQSNFALRLNPGTASSGVGYGVRIGTIPGAATARLNIDGQTLTSASSIGVIDMVQTWNHASANPTAIKLNVTNTNSAADALLMDLQVGSISLFKIGKAGNIDVAKTITPVATTGNQTINKIAGTVNIAAGGTTVTVTNSLVTANSIIMCTVQTNDTTAVLKNVVPAAGSFVINLNAACTAETAIGFFVIN